MAVAAAGGGLLIAAAGAVPAYASAPAAPAAPPGVHTMTITAHPKAGSGIGPHAILPCVAKRGTGIKPASCGDEVIVCFISETDPTLVAGPDIWERAAVDCTSEVDQIEVDDSLLRSGLPFYKVGGASQFDDHAAANPQIACQVGTYSNSAVAQVIFPDGYTPRAGSLHISGPNVTFTSSDCNPPPPSGGGGGSGGGGCAVHAPSLANHPAGRHPDLISCG